ncbi:MAG: hypothetical protein EP338_08030 [Bacteroidetes bacterium]|nr:MAG: hypothetical protein EP338_08030 [Bacteroidota bacterium]
MKNIADLYESGSQASQKGHFRNLVLIARNDGQVLESESALLKNIANKLSLTNEQIKEIFKNPEDYPFIPPVSKEERMERFIRLVKMAMIDGSISDGEEFLVKKLGLSLGFEQDEVNSYMDRIVARIKAGPSTKEIMDSLEA